MTQTADPFPACSLQSPSNSKAKRPNRAQQPLIVLILDRKAKRRNHHIEWRNSWVLVLSQELKKEEVVSE